MSGFFLVFKRDLQLSFRRWTSLLNPLVFFVIVVTLFPLGVGPLPNVLAQVGSGVIWVAALFAVLLSLDALFKADYNDGMLEQLVLSPYSDYFIVLGKVAAYWVVTGVPLILLTPLLALLMNLSFDAMSALMITLLVGTPSLTLIGAIGAALTVGLQRGGVVLALLVLPLYVPILIFGVGAVEAGAAGLNYSGQLAILGAFAMLGLTLSPFAISAAIKVSLS